MLRNWLQSVEDDPDAAFESVKPVISAAIFGDPDRPWWRRAATAAGEETRRRLIMAAAKRAKDRI